MYTNVEKPKANASRNTTNVNHALANPFFQRQADVENENSGQKPVSFSRNNFPFFGGINKENSTKPGLNESFIQRKAFERKTEMLDNNNTGLDNQISNKRTAKSFSTIGGLKPEADPSKGDIASGVLNRLRDAGDVIGTGAGNVVGSIAGAVSGVDIDTHDTLAAAWNPHGSFQWHAGFDVTGRNLQSGWIVQEINNTYSGTTSAGVQINNALIGATPRFYESWNVAATGAVTPNAGATNDMFVRPDLSVRLGDSNTKGRWSILGKAYFTTMNPGMTPGGVPDAGILPSSTSAPSNLGIARLHRYAHGTWDSTLPIPTHTGSKR